MTKISILFLILSFLLVQHIPGIDHVLFSIIALLIFFVLSDRCNFTYRFIENRQDKNIVFTKEFISTLILSVSLIGFLYVGWDFIPLLHDNFDPGTLAFLIFLPFLLLLKKDEMAQTTFFIFLIIPIMVFTKREGIAETAAIATYLCFGILAFRNL